MELFDIQEELDFDLDFPSHRSPFRYYAFDSVFRKFIAKDVIKYLSPQRPGNEDKIDNLIKQIEKYIFGLDKNASDQELANALEQLQALNQPNKVCRKALKPGDVYFACNDCGLDATCVVCIDCFHKSAHKDHNYRMANSDGGGCCDCGDMEAWRQHHACTDHLVPDQPVLTMSDYENEQLRQELLMKDKLNALEKIRRASKAIASRYFLVCEAALQYAHQMLTWEDVLSLPQDLEHEVAKDPEIAPLLVRDDTCKNFFTVLFNDEVHTYDHVINILVKIIKCTKMAASVMASTVSREGRSTILNDCRYACHLVKDTIANVRDSNQSSLKVELMHGTVLAHQAFALKLIEWIRKMSSKCDVFRILTAWSLLEDIERDEASKSSTTLIEAIMIANTTYWKIARVEWNELFVTAMLTDSSMKDQLARLLTRNYRKLMEAFIVDDHEHSVSILAMTTQIYTVPSLVCMLIEEENALAILTQTLIDTCNNSKRLQSASYDSRNLIDVQSLKRGYYIVSDIKYLISIKPTKWTPKLRTNVIEAIKYFLNLLDSMQNMDSVRRQMGQHLEYEPDWESGMTLQGRLIQLITCMVTFCSYDDEVLVQVLKESQRRLIKYSDFKFVKKELFGYYANCIQYDVSSSTVSVHLPLTRFTVAFILELMKRKTSDSIPFNESTILLEDTAEGARKLSMLDIMEPSLRTEVMIAQFRSGMWRRNGYSLVNQIVYYHGAIMRAEMFDRDILALQECAAMTEPNIFLIHLLNKFQLFTWVNSDQTREPLVGPRAVSFQNDEEILAQTMSLGEEFLQLLLTIVGERYCPGIGVVDEKDVLKNEIIQLLCIKPLTRSDLNQKLCVEDNELDCVKYVANFKRSDEASTGKYELKEEFYDRFNPFFYHYTRRQQSNALDAQLKRKKNQRESLICCPPPAPVQLSTQFRNLNELVKCDITLLIMIRVLSRALGPPDDVQECSTKAQIRFFASDLQLDQCLHLIGIGLYEQDRDLFNFKFIENAHFREIFQLLKSCYEKAKRSRDLIFWLMKKTNSILDKLADSPEELTLRVVNEVRELIRPILSSRDDLKQANKKRNSELAARLQNRIMAMMKKDQEKFLSNPSTKQLVADTERTESVKEDDSAMDDEETEDQQSIMPASPTSHLCILCRDQQRIGLDQDPMVLLAYVQRSSLLSKNRQGRRIPNYALTPSNQLKYQSLMESREFSKRGGQPKKYSYTSDNSWSFDATFMPADLFFGPYISSCSHAMHFLCWEGFFQSILKREKGRPNRNARHVSFEIDKFEVLCPLCECISNAIIPLLPNYTNFVERCSKPNQTIFLEKSSIISKSSDSLSSFLRAMRSTVELLKPIRQLKGRGAHSNNDDKYLRLLKPDCINKVLEELEENDALGLREFINSTRHNKISSTDCSKNLLVAILGLADRIHFVGLDLDKSVGDVGHSRLFMMTAWSVSYTTQAFERATRFKGTPLFEDAASPKNLCLTSLIRYAGSCMITLQSDEMQNLLALKLRYLLINDEYLSSSPCCLDIDAFETFVSIFLLLSKLYSHIDDSEPAGWTTRVYNLEYFRNLLHLAVVLNLLQCIVTLQTELTQEDKIPSSSQESLSGECIVLQNFYRDVILASGHPNSVLPECNETLVLRLKCRLLPFMRSCAIFFRHLSDISPPVELQNSTPFQEGKNFTQPQTKVPPQFAIIDEGIDLELVETEFNAICYYLNLPNRFTTLLASPETLHLARSWLRHSRVLLLIKSALEDKEKVNKFKLASPTTDSSQTSLSSCSTSSSSQTKISKTDLMPIKFIYQPHIVNRLIDLPSDYSELVDKVSSFGCPSIRAQDSRTPTLCLVCGVMLCSQSYCCQRDLNELASNYQNLLHHQQGNSLSSNSGQHVSNLSQSDAVAQNFMHNATALLITDSGFSSISPSASSSSAQSTSINQQLVGSCTYHAFECSGGTGVFLRIRNCQILLLSGKSKGCYMPAPYIDDHGETDFGLVRGNPLRLNRQHYEKLQNMWLTHAIPEQVSRTLEYSPYASSINWHLH